MKAKVNQSTELPKAQKSFMQQLREIKIDGESDMFTNFKRLDTATLEKLVDSEKIFKDI